jgi:hypothetical protein
LHGRLLGLPITQIYAKVLTIQNYFYFVYNINLGGFANVLALIAVAAIF